MGTRAGCSPPAKAHCRTPSMEGVICDPRVYPAESKSCRRRWCRRHLTVGYAAKTFAVRRFSICPIRKALAGAQSQANLPRNQIANQFNSARATAASLYPRNPPSVLSISEYAGRLGRFDPNGAGKDSSSSPRGRNRRRSTQSRAAIEPSAGFGRALRCKAFAGCPRDYSDRR